MSRSSPAALPIEAREEAGRRLWQRLLAKPQEDDESRELESKLESKEDGDSDAERAA